MGAFVAESTKSDTKTSRNVTTNKEWAREIFRRDLSVLKFFFDTSILTKIGVERKVNMFDKLYSIGGTLDWYIELSIITMIETG